MLLLVVQNPDGSNKEYYRLDFLDKETGEYLDINVIILIVLLLPS